MSYQVHWVSEAEEEPACIWIRAEDRNLVTRTAFSIDQILAENSENAGESRTGDRRILLHLPLWIMFSVTVRGRVVLVLSVWRFDPRRRNP